MKHTKGKVYQRTQEDAHYVHLEDIINSRAICRVYFRDGEHKSDEDISNAELIAEAFNVTNECGLTPRELLAQQDELLEALEDLHLVALQSKGIFDNCVNSEIVAHAKILINKTKK